jgi:3'-5' exonuclease
MRDTIIVDIETASITDAEQYLEPIEAPANYKNADAIERYVKDATVRAIDRCSLDPDLCRLVALGWMFTRDTEPTIWSCQNSTQERDALEKFWRDYDAAHDPELVTFNGLRFDLPVLMRRSLYLGIRFPLLNLDKYRTPHIDLLDKLTHHGVLTAHSLRFYLSRFGIPVNDEHTGKDVAELVRAGDWAAVAAHCRADVLGTKQLAERIGAVRTREVAEVF